MRAFYLTVTLVLFSWTCVLSYSSANSKAKSWKGMMDSFIIPLQKIYSVDLSKKSFSKKETKTLSEAVSQLKKATTQSKLSKISFFSKKDPAIKVKYDEFLDNIDLADQSLKSGANSKGVYYLKATVSQCASCHSKGGSSTEFFSFFEGLNIKKPEKARLAMALRDYNASMEFYRELLLDKSKTKNLFDLNQYLVNYLNSSILAKTSKKDIIRNLRKLKRKSPKNFVSRSLKAKIRDIKSFEDFSSVQAAFSSYKKIGQGVDMAEKKTYSLLFLKNYLHQALAKEQSNKTRALIYQTLGDIYHRFSEITIFMVPEKNYEMCMASLPKSEIARTCFDKYVRSIVLGYSGSSGIHVPVFEKNKIEKLKKNYL